ncbi:MULTISPECIES: helix-turn-helix transcriptional regulator [Clostridia]|uniref:helix-turn-helix domain-containing protein n=1 Tax=Clostridia TaxID=186801 RepID=UPI002A75E382|nr:helix-turn-helix transcriptional regulator [Zhenhengia yiwuensis]MDY3367550.1 helix-turn-helix transcriptional regulator [Zhenhengia yiwuensis]MDY4948991.1 helix-turn-helix transcriptional regulator [Clostridium cadaveris]
MMYVSYEKLRVLMVKKKIEWKHIRVGLGLAPRTITKLKEDRIVDTDVLIRLCEFFHCDIGDIMAVKELDESL